MKRPLRSLGIALLSITVLAGNAAPAFAHGGGVRNGTAYSCEPVPTSAEMLDVAHARAIGGEVPAIADRADFFTKIDRRVREAEQRIGDSAFSQALASALARNGSVDQWPVDRKAADGSLFEEFANSKYGPIASFDPRTRRAKLANGCTLLQVAALDLAFATGPSLIGIEGSLAFRSARIAGNTDLLDGFNLNVLELHEAAVRIQKKVPIEGPRKFSLNSAESARHLVGALIRSDLSADERAKTIREFMAY